MTYHTVMQFREYKRLLDSLAQTLSALMRTDVSGFSYFEWHEIYTLTKESWKEVAGLATAMMMNTVSTKVEQKHLKQFLAKESPPVSSKKKGKISTENAGTLSKMLEEHKRKKKASKDRPLGGLLFAVVDRF